MLPSTLFSVPVWQCHVVNWDEIFQPIIRHYVYAVRTGFLLFPGSSQPHAAQVCKQRLDVEAADCPLTGPHLHQT